MIDPVLYMAGIITGIVVTMIIFDLTPKEIENKTIQQHLLESGIRIH